MTTKDALLASIDKWDKICFEGGRDEGSDNCQLCLNFGFINGKRKPSCNLCPIGIVTQTHMCNNTPYDLWNDYYVTVIDEDSFDWALQEYFFLCMLYHEYYGD